MALKAMSNSSEYFAGYANCCKILTEPDAYISTINFVYSGLSLLLCIGFFVILSREHKMIEFIQDAKPTETLGFWLPPFLCIFVMIDTLMVGLGTYDYKGTCCLVNDKTLQARYVIHSFIYPMMLVSTFEQTYVTFKRRSANFCCIKFDDGHRQSSKRCSRYMRYSAWFLGVALFGFNLGTNISLIYEPVKPSQMRRFTTKSLLNDASTTDILEVTLLLTFLFYLSAEVWRYGTHFAFQMTMTWLNGWCIMFFGTFCIFISFLLPEGYSIYLADLSVIIFIFTNLMVERMILKDLYLAKEIQTAFDERAEDYNRPDSQELCLETFNDSDGAFSVVNPMKTFSTLGTAVSSKDDPLDRAEVIPTSSSEDLAGVKLEFDDENPKESDD